MLRSKDELLTKVALLRKQVLENQNSFTIALGMHSIPYLMENNVRSEYDLVFFY
jgi:hypothetical protein